MLATIFLRCQKRLFNSISFNAEAWDYTVYKGYVQNVLEIALIFTLEVNVACKT